VDRPLAVRDLREQLAEVSCDVDRYVAVLAEHLTSAVQYERISFALLEAGRRQEAIEWARRGLAERPGWPHTDRLRDVLVDMLLDDGDTEAAMVVRRTEFERHPTATAYRCLADTARAVGAGDPMPWALTVLHGWVAQQPAYTPELIAILLALGDDEQAWLAGLEHRRWIDERQWLSLLERRGVSHPADVIGPYQDMVERYIRDSTESAATGGRSRYSWRCAPHIPQPATRRRSRPTWPTCGYGTRVGRRSSRHSTPPTYSRPTLPPAFGA
jgi:hypothetical protein